MRKLEDLVPPLDLCKKIPEGKFDDSALIWMFDGFDWWVNAREFDATYDDAFPAPTQPEIMEALPKIDDRENCIAVVPDFPDDGEKRILGEAWVVGYTTKNCAKDRNSATAALRLWLEMNEEKNHEA